MLSVFHVAEISQGAIQIIDGDEAHHAIKVMRIAVGEEIIATDGKGHWVQGVVTSVSKSELTLDIKNRGEKVQEAPELIVVQALTKSDRMKEAIELLTVAGVDRIIPWQSERSIGHWKDGAGDKWEQVVIAASKQSRRIRFPIVEKVMNTKELVMRYGDRAIVLHESASLKISDLHFHDSVVLVVGPEGGISESEREQIGGTQVRLGDEVLRSAHAGFAALSAVQALIRRW